jgi:hypothetical protein
VVVLGAELITLILVQQAQHMVQVLQVLLRHQDREVQAAVEAVQQYSLAQQKQMLTQF